MPKGIGYSKAPKKVKAKAVKMPMMKKMPKGMQKKMK